MSYELKQLSKKILLDKINVKLPRTVFVKVMKSEVKGKLGHVVKILVCRKVDSKTLSNIMIISFLRITVIPVQ